jgi:GT2 family glycosyltransferase
VPDTTDKAPFISVVVAPNADPELDTCLRSLARLEYPAERHEVIVVDDGSQGGSDRLVRERSFRHIREPRRGVAYARNAGIRAARGEIVAFTDPDCAVSTGWLAELAPRFENRRVGAVAGAIVPYPPETEAQLYAARRLSHSQLRPLSWADRPFGLTPNLALRKDALNRIGLFDVSFPGGGFEDADLCWRLAERTGLELAYSPRAVAFHRYRATAWQFLCQHFRYGYGLRLLQRKYPGVLEWGWRERARAYGELLEALRRYLGMLARRSDRVTRGDALSVHRFDLLRLLGQRAGFLRAGWATRARRVWRRGVRSSGR